MANRARSTTLAAHAAGKTTPLLVVLRVRWVIIRINELKMQRTITHPLSPWLYFRRNPGKTLPVAFVIVVAVALVASVVTLVNSIDLTVMTMYGYQRHFSVITP